MKRGRRPALFERFAEAEPSEVAFARLEVAHDGTQLLIWQFHAARLEAGAHHVKGNGSGEALVVIHEGAAQLGRFGLQADPLVAHVGVGHMLLPLACARASRCEGRGGGGRHERRCAAE